MSSCVYLSSVVLLLLTDAVCRVSAVLAAVCSAGAAHTAGQQENVCIKYEASVVSRSL